MNIISYFYEFEFTDYEIKQYGLISDKKNKQ